jgi:hypothetical protein
MLPLLCKKNNNVYTVNAITNTLPCLDAIVADEVEAVAVAQPIPLLLTLLARNVGCWHVEMRVKLTDMCLSGQHVANMSANISAT